MIAYYKVNNLYLYTLYLSGEFYSLYVIYYHVILNCLFPLIFILIFGLYFLLTKTINIKKNLIIIFFLSICSFQPTIVKRLFEILYCKLIDDKRYLFIDMRVECYTQNYLTWIILLIIPNILFFCLILPLFHIIYLYRSIKKNFENKKHLLKQYGFLLQAFGIEKFYWLNK